VFGKLKDILRITLDLIIIDFQNLFFRLKFNHQYLQLTFQKLFTPLYILDIMLDMKTISHTLGAEYTIRATKANVLDWKRMLKTKLFLKVFRVSFLETLPGS